MHKSIVSAILKSFLAVIVSVIISGPVLSHDLLSEEKYNYSMRFYSSIKKIYGKKSLVTIGAARFMHHRWFEAKRDFEKIKNKDARVLFFLYTIYKAFNMEQAMNRVIDNIAKTPASRLLSYEKLKNDKAVKEIIYHYYRDHLKPGNGTFEGAATNKNSRPVSSKFLNNTSVFNKNTNIDVKSINVNDDIVQEIIPEAKRFELKKYGFVDLNSDNKALFPEGHEMAGKLIPSDQLIELSMSLEKRKSDDKARHKNIE